MLEGRGRRGEGEHYYLPMYKMFKMRTLLTVSVNHSEKKEEDEDERRNHTVGEEVEIMMNESEEILLR